MANNKGISGIEWKKYFFELVVIILGITISFMVQNWKEERDHRKAGVETLTRIYNDLKEDTASMNTELAILKNLVRYNEKLLNFRQLDDVSDSLNVYLQYQMQYTVFSKTDIGYTALEQSTPGQLIANQALLDKIIRHYAIRYKELTEFQDVDKTFVLGQFIPYFNNNFPYVENFDFQAYGAARFEKVLKNDVFRNLLRTNNILKKQSIARYQQTVNEVAVLMQEIEQETSMVR